MNYDRRQDVPNKTIMIMKNILRKTILAVMALMTAITISAQDHYTGQAFVSGDGFMYKVDDASKDYTLDNTANSLTTADMGYIDGTPLNPLMPSGLVRADNDGVGRALRETFTRDEMQRLKNVNQRLWINIVVNTAGNIVEVGFTVWNSSESRGIKPQRFYTLEQKIKEYVQFSYEQGYKKLRHGRSFIGFDFADIAGEGQAVEEPSGGNGGGGYEPWIPPVETGPIAGFKLDEGVQIRNNSQETYTVEVFIDDADVGYDDGTSSNDNWAIIVQINPMTPQYQPGFLHTMAPGEEWAEFRSYHVSYAGGYGSNWVSFVKPGVYFQDLETPSNFQVTYFLTLEDANGYNLVSINGGEEIWEGSDRIYIPYTTHYGTVVCPAIRVEIEIY